MSLPYSVCGAGKIASILRGLNIDAVDPHDWALNCYRLFCGRDKTMVTCKTCPWYWNR